MIVIPMAGRSSRFFKAGYTEPKYELRIGDETLFALSVKSFEAYFASEKFVFVCRSDMNAEAFVRQECARIGVVNFECVVLEKDTRGQAETVLIGLQEAGATPLENLLIFNIDTIRPKYRFPSHLDWSDGYLEVFTGPGENWSFVRPASGFSARVSETSEKRRISNLCCTGLYHFSRVQDFVELCEDAIFDIGAFREKWGELYVAPLYNAFIALGAAVTYHHISPDEVMFSGTPQEYELLIATRG